ncbi:ligase-associated DNA damage response endonuclease PdeM [Myxococcus sp. K15C18031901]|uniref:ligase-associated DNA damage response endonuclease PdeM n=1 Tax=Myxococcus dinghuensis TaxID=2906761 RepID=UPI0020A776BE|nr:ligase-associated DNA damage response endonuclease PdeM [Myxococcus dinghuensis]MCP3102959.1 ligase-associated DNA damage response endonuclease PdeM [Myxococcus dinghuensis]
MDPGRRQVRVGGATLELLAERALHWPDAGLVAVADLHWGKTETFQRHGIPLPMGVLEDDLARLSSLLTSTRACRLLLLGDLVHTREGLTPTLVQRLAAWRRTHADVELVLLRGNHDRKAGPLPSRWNLVEHEDHLEEGPFRFTHHPAPVPGRYVWAGHLHPMARLSSGGERLRLPCFHVGPEVGVLPAFSAFTGGLDVVRRPGERVFALAGPSIIEV